MLENEIHRLKFVEHGLRTEIHKLREALAVYAEEGNWRVLFLGGDAELRLWVGPGEGPVLGKLALVGGLESPNSLPASLRDEQDARGAISDPSSSLRDVADRGRCDG